MSLDKLFQLVDLPSGFGNAGSAVAQTLGHAGLQIDGGIDTLVKFGMDGTEFLQRQLLQRFARIAAQPFGLYRHEARP